MPSGIYVRTKPVWNKGKRGVQVAWNKGKHPEYLQGKNHPMFSKHHSEETKRKISFAKKGFKHTEETKRKIGQATLGYRHTEEAKRKISFAHSGSKNHWWKGGLPKCVDCGKQLANYGTERCKVCSRKGKRSHFWGKKGPECMNWTGGLWKKPETRRKLMRDYRHRKGISKKHIVKYGGKKIPKRLYKQQYLALMKAAGPLPISTIQRVYEENIKEFGTLTCIYCFKPTRFGNDTLEHIIPLIRGGTNKYENLAISCRGCNSSKNKKLLEEWIK